MTQEVQPNSKSRKSYVGWIIFFVIVLGLTLPFHYVPSAMRMFPKDHFTFKHTIITQKDIDKIIDRFNNASILEQTSINNDPFIRTLREQGIIVDKDKKNNNDNNDY